MLSSKKSGTFNKCEIFFHSKTDAFDLMHHIAGYESTKYRGNQDKRYWLGL